MEVVAAVCSQNHYIFLCFYFYFILMLLAIFTLYNSAGITGYQILCYLPIFCFCSLLVLLLKLLNFLSRLIASSAHGSTCGRSAGVY